jgi:hypothetical protein
MGKRNRLRGGRHPYQVEGSNLMPVGGFEQLDASPELLVEPPLAVFVFFTRHIRV